MAFQKTKPKLYVFTKYSKNGASSRVRFFKYQDFLSKGYDISVHSLWDEDYLEKLYSKSKISKFKILKQYALRFLAFSKCFFGNYDIVWIEKELFPWLPIPIEIVLKLTNKKVIFDYDDAVFNNYNNNILKALFELKFKIFARHSDTIMCGNEYISNYFKDLGAERTDYLPTVIDIEKYIIPQKKSTNKVIIGWIGSPSTQKYLKIVDDVIHRLQINHEVEFHVIGGSISSEFSSNIKYIRWTENTEVSNLNNFDIGIMPLFDSDFERGKCGYKLIQYLALSIPVVASAVGVNQKIVNHGNNGYLSNNESDWYNYLEKLIINSDLRKTMGILGRDSVVHEYTYQVQEQRLKNIISRTLSLQ